MCRIKKYEFDTSKSNKQLLLYLAPSAHEYSHNIYNGKYIFFSDFFFWKTSESGIPKFVSEAKETKYGI